jgi:hypothetical protein
VAELSAMLDEARRDLGDLATETEGTGVRTPGHVENARPLTEYDENHPYIIAMYDMFDRTGPEPKYIVQWGASKKVSVPIFPSLAADPPDSQAMHNSWFWLAWIWFYETDNLAAYSNGLSITAIHASSKIVPAHSHFVKC